MFCFVDSKAWNNVYLHGHTVIVATGKFGYSMHFGKRQNILLCYNYNTK